MCGNIVYINGHRWRVIDGTTARPRVYSWREVEECGGNPRRLPEIPRQTSDDYQRDP